MGNIKFFKSIVLICVFCYLPFSSSAWGLLGHRVVGEIAESYLTRRASREVKKILGNESLAMASNWADFIKSNPAYKYLDTWHYVNMPPGTPVEGVPQALQTDTVANVYNRIQFIATELKNKNLDPEKKVMYLRLLIHFVGDVHQPMHTRGEALGGNRIGLMWFGQSSNLHRVWDSDLIESQQLSYTEYSKAINFPGKQSLNTWMQQPPSVWVQDSYVLGARILSEVKQDDKLSYRYVYDYLDTANQQMLKGGIHLAALLNQIFGS